MYNKNVYCERAYNTQELRNEIWQTCGVLCLKIIFILLLIKIWKSPSLLLTKVQTTRLLDNVYGNYSWQKHGKELVPRALPYGHDMLSLFFFAVNKIAFKSKETLNNILLR